MNIKTFENGEVYNSKHGFLAVFSEFYFFNSIELSEMQIEEATENHLNCDNLIEHGVWKFCFHPEREIVYLL